MRPRRQLSQGFLDVSLTLLCRRGDDIRPAVCPLLLQELSPFISPTLIVVLSLPATARGKEIFSSTERERAAVTRLRIMQMAVTCRAFSSSSSRWRWLTPVIWLACCRALCCPGEADCREEDLAEALNLPPDNPVASQTRWLKCVSYRRPLDLTPQRPVRLTSKTLPTAKLMEVSLALSRGRIANVYSTDGRATPPPAFCVSGVIKTDFPPPSTISAERVRFCPRPKLASFRASKCCPFGRHLSLLSPSSSSSSCVRSRLKATGDGPRER